MIASDFLRFINASPSPYHAVAATADLLRDAGFTVLSERTTNAEWRAAIVPGAKVMFTRNQSTIFALTVGEKYQPGNGFSIIGAHTDSPVFRVKPISKVTKHGCLQVGVECYGGGLWNTWFDRDLGIAGRVITQTPDGTTKSSLVRIDRPILSIPNLAIHLNRGIYDSGFKPNFETHCLPIISTQLNAEVNGATSESGNHHSVLINLLAKELSVEPEHIMDFELSLFDVQPSCVSGAFNEFIHSARLDNLCMSYCSLRALLDSSSDGSLANESMIRMVALFDHEEIGSSSAQGAASNMMRATFQRIAGAEYFDQTVRKSFLISADMAHALHPNYPEKHEMNHRPLMQKGLVIKYNCKQRYATNSQTAFLLKSLARKHDIPIQEFVVRNDVGCGSTIGPILSANTGIRTVDVGIPQLAMHSIREMCGIEDVASATELLKVFFSEFSQVDFDIDEE